MMMDGLFFRDFLEKNIDHVFNAHFLAIVDCGVFSRIDAKLGFNMGNEFLPLVECMNKHFKQSVSTIGVHFCRYAQRFYDLTAHLQDLLLIFVAFAHRKHVRFLFLHF
jgi:hypothetical protein